MFAFTFRKLNIINKLMAAGWMSHHLFIRISDPCGGEKNFANTYSKNISNGCRFSVIDLIWNFGQFYTILSLKDIFIFFFMSDKSCGTIYATYTRGCKRPIRLGFLRKGNKSNVVIKLLQNPLHAKKKQNISIFTLSVFLFLLQSERRAALMLLQSGSRLQYEVGRSM